MTNLVTSTAKDTATPAVARPPRGRPARTGFLSGLLSGVCCLGGAIAVATGLGALSFFRSWMDQYQVYFILASLIVMGIVILRTTRRFGLRHARAIVVRHAAVMLAVYVVTFGVAGFVYGIATR
jgi:hypothetical protein